MVELKTLKDMDFISTARKYKIRKEAIKWVKYYVAQGKLFKNDMWFAKAEATMEQNNITEEDLK